MLGAFRRGLEDGMIHAIFWKDLPPFPRKTKKANLERFAFCFCCLDFLFQQMEDTIADKYPEDYAPNKCNEYWNVFYNITNFDVHTFLGLLLWLYLGQSSMQAQQVLYNVARILQRYYSPDQGHSCSVHMLDQVGGVSEFE